MLTRTAPCPAPALGGQLLCPGTSRQRADAFPASLSSTDRCNGTQRRYIGDLARIHILSGTQERYGPVLAAFCGSAGPIASLGSVRF